ncbi:hypothetical protein [Aeromonas sp. Prich7-2]|uniref:hypothetical protein n=1 Tax=Aeromonas sp. Prich7-2 TaxID=2823361 RepID=UPI001B33EF66|nr:hypothetical protein [Aeromonas sp. Prich7-2]MBP4059586.1 hypothetical protein [Aeromonas sp. Prich7-2]
MKNLTEAQVMGFRGAMVPPTRRKYHVDAAPSAEQKRMAKTHLIGTASVSRLSATSFCQKKLRCTVLSQPGSG